MSYLDHFHYTILCKHTDSEVRKRLPKLVFLHGIFGFSSNFRSAAREFEDQFEVLIYDQRGHGRSFHPSSGYAPDDYAADLERILDELGWQKINLVGHSMGGRVALYFAHSSPHRVEKLVMVDIGPVLGKGRAQLINRIIDRVPCPFADRTAAKLYFKDEFIRDFSDQDHVEGLSQFLYANLIEQPDGKVTWRFYVNGILESAQVGREMTHWEKLKALAMPTLVIRGGKSKDLPEEIYWRMLQSNEKIQGIEIAGAGHWVHADRHEEFVRGLREFLTNSHLKS